MSEFEVRLTFDANDLTRQLKKKIEGYHGITKNYRLHADLANTWFSEDTYVAHFVPCKTGTLVSSGRWVGSRRAFVWDPVDKYGHSYGQAQWTGNNGTEKPASEWKRANNYGHVGRRKWADIAKQYRWKKFLREYATPTIIEAINNGEYK